MIVVSNTSPLTNLAAIGHFDLLHQQGDLDRGEAETIARALELDSDLVLMDEEEGRHTARRFGLRVIGVVGVLLDAKSDGVIEAVRPYLDALRQTAGFYLGDAVYGHALSLAGEHEE
jgi:predicted nucleic acid-binding protein